ncbi:unnamed protein product [Rotaria magnacalcarata]|uniref:Uncharacterized protein n=1 Tax=Rotaria magnacalcarata TaxID=392030 RepID=A0A816T2F0_9BILA|nr:unnamed protein product [Rotaria magnacalcarata]CAF3803399.1 unnamed protein product [Rotaria magnacalcarata]
MYNIRAASIASQFLAYCHYQIECVKYFLTDSPGIIPYKILQDIDSNNQLCIKRYLKKYNLTLSLIKSILFSIFQSAANYYDRSIISAVIFRLNRCNKEDVLALDLFFQAQGLSSSASSSSEPLSTDANTPVLNFDVLYYNIAFSELWLYFNQSDIDQQALNTFQNATIIAPDLPSDLIALIDAWPKCPLDKYRCLLANSSMLMIAARLDGTTPLDFASHLASITRKTRTFYTIPLSGHIIQLSLTTAGYTCPLHLILSWTFPSLFPSECNKPSCITDLPTMIDFVGETEMVQMSSLKIS